MGGGGYLDSYVAAAAGTWRQVLGCYDAHLDEVKKRVVPSFRKRPEDLYVRMYVYTLPICICNVHTHIYTHGHAHGHAHVRMHKNAQTLFVRFRFFLFQFTRTHACTSSRLLAVLSTDLKPYTLKTQP
jgi:hypothetical protein